MNSRTLLSDPKMLRIGDISLPTRFSRGATRPGWLVTFIDLISLLLAFFIMMFSMSSLKTTEWEVFKGSLLYKKQLEVSATQKTGKTTTLERPESSAGIDLGYLRSILEAGLNEGFASKLAIFEQEQDYLLISLPSKLLFNEGSVEVSAAGERALFTLSETLSNIENRVSLIGHSDPTPMAPGNRYKNNWALSLARAYSVGQTLLESGYRKPIRILSLADTAFEEISSNKTDTSRFSAARRVDLVIHSDKDKP